MATILYQDQFLPRDRGRVDMEDRGYQFGDGIYEAIRVYGGRLFLLDLHMKRLERSAGELRLQLPYSIGHLTDNLQTLIEKNKIDDGLIYFQITRGAAPRKHLFPEGAESVLTGSAINLPRRSAPGEAGIKVSLIDDIRWLRCDIKTLNLLGNVLAKQEAHEQGSEEAILHRGNTVTEGSSCNVFIVKEGRLVTHPADHFILNGITRLFVLGLAKKLSIPVEERLFSTEELFSADEVFITSTGAEVTPVVRIDNQLIAGGRPGAVARRLIDAFNEEVARIRTAALS
ncbi:D-amino-acid transaminase [Sporolactobacillus sp. KGMB 08714]|uniref:D-amino-acid transaminase n=1 Tax=Sporolactobacillus sp. KGMB 08714 TaxID=3064704 RepID=UPI002FBDCB3C